MSLTVKGIIGMVLTHFIGGMVPQEDLAIFINVAGFIITALVAYWGRYRAGGISALGTKE